MAIDKTPLLGSYTIIQPTKSYFLDWFRGYPEIESGVFFKEPEMNLEDSLLFKYALNLENNPQFPEEFVRKVCQYKQVEVYFPRDRWGRRFLNTTKGQVLEFDKLTEPALKTLFDQISKK